jgi:phosphoglycerate-specific signal transduction histidine kinase
MAAPNRLTRKLNEILGPEATDAMTDWMNRSDENTADLRREIGEFRQEVRADFAEFRQEVHAEFARVRQEMTTEFAAIRQEMTTEFAAVRQEMTTDSAEMRVGFSRIDARLAEADKAAAQRQTEFLRWTVGFWLVSLATLIGSIAAFASILAR